MLPITHHIKIERPVILKPEIHTKRCDHFFELIVCFEKRSNFKFSRESFISELIAFHSISHSFNLFVFAGHVDVLVGFKTVGDHIYGKKFQRFWVSRKNYPIHLSSVFFGSTRQIFLKSTRHQERYLESFGCTFKTFCHFHMR